MPKRNRESSASSISMPSSLPMPTSPQIFPEAGKANGYMEFRYKSAAGKVFYSLRSACQSVDASQTLDVDSLTTSFAVVPKTTMTLLPPLYCMKSNKRRKMRMRSMKDIMKDDRSVISGASVVLGRPSPVTGRGDLSWSLLKSELKDSKIHCQKLNQVPPLFCMKSFYSRNKSRKMRMRSMKDIMKDDRSVISGAGGVLGRPSPVTGRGDLSWSLLKSELKDSKIHCQKLNRALEVMHESFERSIDPVTHTDVAEDFIFNEERDFYTVVLEMQDKVVTVANVRVHKGGVAEVPLVATAFDFRRQGMCKVLMNEIENWLRSSGIERVVLPSTKSALKTWTSETMGFSTMGEDEKADLLIAYDSCLDFQGTTMCQKQLLKKNEECDGNSSDGSTISHEEHAYIYVEG